MLEFLRGFLHDVTSGKKPANRFAEDDYRRAAAALLIHVSMIDGETNPSEHLRLRGLLQRAFSLDETDVSELIRTATEDERESVDLYAFTSLLNHLLDEQARRNLVAMMWQIVFADGQINEFEDDIVWRASDLLGISAQERMELRHAVAVINNMSDCEKDRQQDS